MKSSPIFDIEVDELEIFLQDVNEHLQTMEAGILELEKGADPEILNSIFRAAHTLKAIAGVVGHHPMADLTHAMETLFDTMRQEGLAPSHEMADELLAIVDVLRTLRDEVVSGQAGGVDAAPILAQLRALLPPAGGASARAQETPRKIQGLTPDEAARAESVRQEGFALFQVDAVADREAFAPAARLLQAALALAERGEVIVQRPSQEELLEDRHDGRLWLIMATEVEMETIEGILSDVSELAEFQVQPWAPDKGPVARTAASPRRRGRRRETLEETIGELFGGIGELVKLDVKAGAAEMVPAELEKVASPERWQPAGQKSAASRARKSPGNGRPQRGGRDNGREGETTVRISVERLDNLMDLVGEMVTDRTRLEQVQDTLRAQYGKEENVNTLETTIAHVGQVVDQLQDEVMRARMLPIARLFEKFPRLVRDVARTAGKEVQLVVEGEATELDRSVIEAIGDPLIHLLRNAVDHGIERPDERAAAGKSPAGLVRLTAEHREGQIMITVTDDGEGIDPEQIRRAAVQRGMLSEEEAARLSDDEAVTQIFRPGLSTAEQVTDVSGRGVGLDIVRTNIGRIGGSVTVESEVGWGTTFRVMLPLTLATVQTMLVNLAEDVYAIPLTSIIESLYLTDIKVNSIKGNPAIRWRGNVLPLLDLCQFFGRGSAAPLLSNMLARDRQIPASYDETGASDGVPAIPLERVAGGGFSSGPKQEKSKTAIVVVVWGKLQIGLIVNRILGKQEIVAKPLGSVIGNAPGLSGCTILGNGDIALIVDVPGLINATMQTRTQTRREESL